MLDINELKENYLMDESSIIHLLNLFLESTKTDFRLLKEAFENKDENSIYKYAHKLKSGAAYFYLKEISLLFEKIQNQSKYKNFEIIASLIKECESQLEIIFKQINKYQN